MTVTVARDRVTAAFLKVAGGYAKDGVRLIRIVRPPSGPNGRTVLVEDCYTLKNEGMDRARLLKLDVVQWPDELR